MPAKAPFTTERVMARLSVAVVLLVASL
ncbi:MAG: hypothetical protein FD127_4199, partial [Acidimicrobiaceae bacterium]